MQREGEIKWIRDFNFSPFALFVRGKHTACLFLTAAAVLGIAFTPPPPLKTDEKCCQKAELGFTKCNFQNSDKEYSAYGVRTKQLFLPSKKKAEMNFTQSMGFAEGLYAITITLHILSFACRCHETGLIPVLFK